MMFILTLLFCSSVDAGRFDDVEIRFENVKGNVWCLFGAGGNIGIFVGEDGILMIDDQFAPLANKIKASLKKKFNKKIKYIINTHWHGDHNGGNESFSNLAPIIAHQNVKTRLQKDQKRGKRLFPKRPKEAWPSISYQERLEIEFNGEEILLIHMPHGHTDGDSIVYFTQTKVLHMGDLFFTNRFPFIDLESGGSVAGYLENLSFILENFDAKVRLIPGHGVLSSMKELKVYYEMIVKTNQIVKSKKDAGFSLEAIIEEGLGKEFQSFHWGFIPEKKWIKTLYRDLQKEIK